ncbi:MAG: hypothetical protein IPM16_19060 [Chloroflexi bacterium]|nr:hypothetical protein [Chloroflexota bacterium]
MAETAPQSERKKRVYVQGVPEKPFELRVTLFDGLLLAATVAFIVVAIIDAVSRFGELNAYLVTRAVHYQLSRYGLIAAAVMGIVAFVLGVVRKDDVTPWFRRGAYVVFGSMLLQAILGFVLLLVFGVQPGQPEHIVYGIATAACLPFFIFVETTAKKRPAMGSYIWAFVLLAGVVVRAIGTGPAV